MEVIQGKDRSAMAEQKQCCSREEQVQKKAYELYEKRGRVDGNDFADWLEAERLVRSGKA